jgi:hypothetical protein
MHNIEFIRDKHGKKKKKKKKVNFQERLFALNIKSSEKFYIKILRILSHTFF